MTRCIKLGVKDKVHHVQRKQIDSHKACSECLLLVRTQACKRDGHWSTASSLILATAPSRATHAADAVAAHQCHEIWSHTNVAE